MVLVSHAYTGGGGLGHLADLAWPIQNYDIRRQAEYGFGEHDAGTAKTAKANAATKITMLLAKHNI